MLHTQKSLLLICLFRLQWACPPNHTAEGKDLRVRLRRPLPGQLIDTRLKAPLKISQLDQHDCHGRSLKFADVLTKLLALAKIKVIQ